MTDAAEWPECPRCGNQPHEVKNGTYYCAACWLEWREWERPAPPAPKPLPSLCPFCGHIYGVVHSIVPERPVKCRNCGATGPDHDNEGNLWTASDYLAAWNLRSSPECAALAKTLREVEADRNRYREQCEQAGKALRLPCPECAESAEAACRMKNAMDEARRAPCPACATLRAERDTAAAALVEAEADRALLSQNWRMAGVALEKWQSQAEKAEAEIVAVENLLIVSNARAEEAAARCAAALASLRNGEQATRLVVVAAGDFNAAIAALEGK